jgi:hypothetical protein
VAQSSPEQAAPSGFGFWQVVGVPSQTKGGAHWEISLQVAPAPFPDAQRGAVPPVLQ